MSSETEALIPHRAPMHLLSEVITLKSNYASALVKIHQGSSFFIDKLGGVPSWIGVEYMGQTAAMIAGFQLREGLIGPHVGLLLGTRKYEASVANFRSGINLEITCKELAVVGDNLATFSCDIHDHQSHVKLASAKLSVFRKLAEN